MYSVHSYKFSLYKKSSFFLPILRRDNLHHCQRVSRHGKADVCPGKCEAVYPLGVVLIGGPGVLRQNPQQRLPFCLRRQPQQMAGTVHRQAAADGCVRETACGLRMGVGIGNVGFDVIDGVPAEILSDAHDCPEVQRRGESQNETCEQDRRPRPFKLAVLLVVKIAHGHLAEKGNG